MLSSVDPNKIVDEKYDSIFNLYNYSITKYIIYCS